MEVQEFGSLTICALRYCHGRMTYMPSLIVDATKENWNYLHKNDKEIIRKDLQYALETSNMGMSFDKQMWQNFYDWILV